MGALQGAYGYAQDLNKSLNNIRIVTGQSIDQMAKFADEANRAAKELSTTTTRYTDAALIYYQQGLTGKAVTDRVEATVKLANVSRQSAEEVSSQMTAIWNNFDDGSKKLEYYADVITALGAATASSSDEIAQGLQKFAAVADTVGLSYEKATAALATVVAETRQSADVVGTAFKTMFARFQGVTLGETLEDGVGLNKYSKALATVGVDILEANGNLKDMDTILDELGEKWNQIGNAQQVALAETVAGTRQYAQFMAIMENYDKILANQNLAEGSEGTLEQQAKIYAESWEAARDRVKTALQGIYSQLLDDNAFIAGLNGLEKFIDAIGGAIKGLGGLKTILLMVGSIVASKYANEMPNIIQKLTGNFSVLTGAAEKHRIAMIQDADAIIQQMNAAQAGTKGFQAQISSMQLVSKMTAELEAQKKNLSRAEIEAYQQKIKEVELYGQVAIGIGQEIDALQQETAAQSASVNAQLYMSEASKNQRAELGQNIAQVRSLSEELLELQQLQANPVPGTNMSQLKQNIQQIENEIKQTEITIQQLRSSSGSVLLQNFKNLSRQAGELNLILNESATRTKTWRDNLNSGDTNKIAQVNEEVREYVALMEKAGIDTSQFKDAVTGEINTETFLSLLEDQSSDLWVQLYDVLQSIQELREQLVQAGVAESSLDKIGKGMERLGALTSQSAAQVENLKKKYQALPPHTISASEALSRLGSAAMAVGSAFNAIKNIGSIWNDKDASTGEKILQTLMSLGMLLPAINTLLNKQTLSAIAASFSLKGLAVAQMANTAATTAATGATIAFGTALKALPIGWVITILGALVGIIALIAKEIETPAEKLKRLRQEEEELIEVTEKAKNEWKEFTNTISQYDEALEGLKKLTAGTTEFNEQLQQSNALARSLISSLSLEFLKDFVYDANGAIVFTEWGRNRINEAQTQGLKAQSALDFQVAQAKERTRKAEYEANNRYEYDETERSLVYEKNRSEYAGQWKPNELEYDIIHGMVASFMNEFTDENGKIQKTGYGAFTDQERQELIESIQGRYNSQPEEEIAHLVDYMLGKLESEYQSFGTDYVPSYNEQKTIIAGQLDSQNPFANAVADALFSDTAIIDNTENQILSDLKDKGILTDAQAKTELDKIFDYLDEDTLDEMIEKAGSAMNLLVSTKATEHLVTQAQDNLRFLENEFDVIKSENRDSVEKILTNNASKISPAEIERLSSGGLSASEKYIAETMYKHLYPTATKTFSDVYNEVLKEYNAADFYRMQVKDIDEVRESIKNYNKELKSLKLGDTIQPKIYKDLSEGAKTYFQLMEDGTYKLVGNAEQLQDILFKETTAKFDENLQNLQKVGETDQLTPEDAAKIQENAIAYAMATETLSQLNYVKERFNELGIDAQTQTIAENAALQDLATKYESCTDDLEAYQHALATNNKNLVEAAKNTLEYSIAVAELSQKHGFDAKQTEAYAKRLKDNLASSMKEAGFSEKQLEKSALAAAIANQRLDRGLLSLNKNLDSYKKTLEQTDKNSIEWSNTMESLKTDLADILDMDISVLTDELAESFLTNSKYSALLTQALDGNVEAIKRLREIAADDMMQNIQSSLAAAGEDVADFMTQWDSLKAMMAAAMKSGGIDQTALVKSFNELIEKGHMTKDQIEAALAGMHVAADIETEYHEQKTTVPTTITEEHFERGTPGTYEYVDGDGNKKTVPFNTYKRISTTYEGPPATVTGYVPTYKIKGTTGPGSSTSKISQGNPPPKNRQSGSQKSFISDTGESFVSPLTTEVTTNAFSPITDSAIQASFGSTTTGLKDQDKSKGGGSSKSNTKSVEEHIDEEHRYDELNKQLEGLSKQYDRLGKARDRAWGKNKIALLEQELDKLKQMQKVYERYLQTVAGDNWKNLHDTLQSGGNVGALIRSGKAGGDLQKDFNKIVSVVKNAIEYKSKNKNGEEELVQVDWRGLKDVIGIDVMLNEFGEIANKDDIEEAIEAWWNKQIDEWNEMSPDEQALNQGQLTELQAIKSYMEKILNQYSETVNTFTENSDKLMDNFYAQQDKFYEEFRYKVDLKVEISERSLKRIEYAIKVLGDNIYKVPEVMQTWFDQRVNKTKDEVKNLGSTWTSAFYDAQAAYQAGQISQADYVETIKDAQDGLYQCIDELLEINEEMREYYKNVLSKVKEEMSRITDEMDHQLNTFTHLTNVLSLLGRETDYEALGVILNGQLKATRNGYEVSKAQTEMYRRQVESAEAELQALMAEGVSNEALEEWKNAVLYPAKEALLEAEAEMQADFEAYLEVINAIYENKINKIYQDSERRLSGAWGSFDEVNKAMERQHALDDEYLTKTNQIYETNTLLRKLAQDIDKTNNQAAKTRIKNFSDEIEGLQQKTKLSKSELDIAKARYEVLLAEIALEDARNAKSTVRLQRDNEGNYGYVYTADADAIADAEQGLEDKKNDLYNLVLGQANDYTEKIIQLTQERNAALQQLDMDYKEGRIKDEETYNFLKQQIIEKYNDLIQADYESYYRALEWLDVTAATDHTEAWGTSFQDILTLGEDFENETNTLMAETGEAISELNALRAEATEEAKVGAGELEQQVEELTKANDELAKEMTGEVIPAMETVLDTAQALTAEWIRQYDEIMALINAYLDLIDIMNTELNNMSGVNGDFDPNKDYSLAATQAYLANGGTIDQAVLDELYGRAAKEAANGGHNTAWATNEQILEAMDRASKGDQGAMDLLQSIAAGEQFYRTGTMADYGITGEGYSLEEFSKSLSDVAETNRALKDAVERQIEQTEEASDQSVNAQEATEEATDSTVESAELVQTSAEELGNTITEASEQLQGSTEESIDRIEAAAEDTVSRVETSVEDGIASLNDAASMLVDSAATLGGQIDSAAGTIAGAISEIGGMISAAGFASGGYTGEWGSTGKLAMLHEKELVLNAGDTENILTAVGILREFSSAIDLRAAVSSFSSGLSSPTYTAGEQIVEQDVTIHAEFPNATNHSEIEEAFNTLINRASQYANRR